ncbi:MAG: hypothetical protein AB9866_00365 [Syntrophobacteraceae bacterium]
MHTAHSFMDRTIFMLKISTLATSLYILLCKLLDDDLPPTLERLRRIWAGTEQELVGAAEELVREGILVPMDFSQENKRWWMYPSTSWFPNRREHVRH